MNLPFPYRLLSGLLRRPPSCRSLLVPNLRCSRPHSHRHRNKYLSPSCVRTMAHTGQSWSQALPGGVSMMPRMLYGTAWKTERTADLVFAALQAGFRGVDTAAMAKHYNEAGAGEGIRRAVAAGVCARADLFVQTKFSPGDEAYADRGSIADRVAGSVASSLRRLATPDGAAAPYIDCLVLHSPYPDPEDTLAAWAAMRAFVPDRVRGLGISNVTHAQLVELLAREAFNPAPVVVQNRFFPQNDQWDRRVRPLCAARGIRYQGFWTLTATGPEWTRQGYVGAVADGAGVGRATAWYALLLAADITLLNGTTDPEHMREDLDGLARVEEWRKTEEGAQSFANSLRQFRERTGTQEPGFR